MKKTLTFCSVMIISFSLATAQNIPVRKPFEKPVNPIVNTKSINQFTVTPITNIQDIINILFGPGIAVSNLTFTGASISMGHFIDTSGSLGMDSGLVMTTGSIYNVPGPNISTAAGTANQTPGDSNLNQIVGTYPTYDACVISFDFTPLTDTLIAAKMVFGSEEYPEFAGSSFNDVFAFYISGPGFNGLQNIAYLPGTTTAITINNVNHITNSGFYVNNTGGQVIEYDGYTVMMPLTQAIQIGQTYHFKIAIADVADGVYDSGVFLKQKSFLGYAKMPAASYTYILNGFALDVTNTSTSSKYNVWDFGDGTIISDSTGVSHSHTYNANGNYNVKLFTYNFYQKDSVIQAINVNAVDVAESLPMNNSLSVRTLEPGHFQLDAGEAWMEQLSVYYSDGRLVPDAGSRISGNTLSIDLRELPSGIYLVEITGRNCRKVVKLQR